MRPLLAISTTIDCLNEKVGCICNILVLGACLVSAGNTMRRRCFHPLRAERAGDLPDCPRRARSVEPTGQGTSAAWRSWFADYSTWCSPTAHFLDRRIFSNAQLCIACRSILTFPSRSSRCRPFGSRMGSR